MGPFVVVLHGGPGAPGYMAPVARKLAGSFRVLEPLQRGRSAEPLTVARHVADLHEVLRLHCRGQRPALVGHSWGAMLALAYAAKHPDGAAGLALIACGTFDPVARARLRAIREERMEPETRLRMERLAEEFPREDERLRELGKIMTGLDSFDLLPDEGEEEEECDLQAHSQSWNDMLRLQQEGVYPAAFAAIRVPVVMLHGTVDSHPGRLIQVGLVRYLPQLEYREWLQCGHYPWRERKAHREFYEYLETWLRRCLGRSSSVDRGRD